MLGQDEGKSGILLFVADNKLRIFFFKFQNSKTLTYLFMDDIIKIGEAFIHFQDILQA